MKAENAKPTPALSKGQIFLLSEQTLAPLRLRLALRGLSVAPAAHEEGGPTHEALATAALCLLHVTPASLADRRGFQRELDGLRAETRRRRTPVIVLRDGVDPGDLDAHLRLAAEGWRDILPGQRGPLSPTELEAAAGTILGETLRDYGEAFLDGPKVSIGLYTELPRGTIGTPTLLLDWRELYQPYPSLDAWSELLLPALGHLREHLGALPFQTMELAAFARLSAGVALGYSFRSVTDADFAIRQGRHWWHAARQDFAARPFGEPEPLTVGSGPDLSLELNINQPTGKLSEDVGAYLEVQGPQVGRRLRLDLPGGPRHIDEDEANAIASQVRTLLQRYRKPDGVIHLFLAAPLALAVMIGRHLNALTPVQCYDLPEGGGSYIKACKLTQL